MRRQNQRRDPSYVRRGHRGARGPVVLRRGIAGHGEKRLPAEIARLAVIQIRRSGSQREDAGVRDVEAPIVTTNAGLSAGGGHVQRHTPVGVVASLIQVIGRGDGDHLRQILRAVGAEVVIAVAGRHHDDNTLLVGEPHRLVENRIGGARQGARPTGVDDPRAVLHGIDDRPGQRRQRPGAPAIERLDAHQLDAGGDPHNPKVVVVHGGDDPGDMGAVAMVVHRIGVECVSRIGEASVAVRIARVGEIDAVDVIGVAVAVLVDPVVRDLGTVGPDILAKVLVTVVHAGVNRRHDDAVASADRPRAVGADELQPPQVVVRLAPCAG